MPCSTTRSEKDQGAKQALLSMEKVTHAIDIMAQARLSPADAAYLQHAVVERPNANGNDSFARLKEAVRIRLALEARHKTMPPKLAGADGHQLFKLVEEVYETGRGDVLESSVVFQMMLNLLQKFAGIPNAAVSAKVFCLARSLRHISRPAYEFFRRNTLVGPHVETIRKHEAKAGVFDPIISVDESGVFFLLVCILLYLFSYVFIFI